MERMPRQTQIDIYPLLAIHKKRFLKLPNGMTITNQASLRPAGGRNIHNHKSRDLEGIV